MYYAIQLPKRVVFGSGIADKVGGEAKLLGGKRALIVTDETMETVSYTHLTLPTN